jgi:hypothetical protein
VVWPPRWRHAATFLIIALSLTGQLSCGSDAGTETKLTDEEFWILSTDLSEEPTGAFTHSENLVSNETNFVHTIRMLQPAGGAYIGVGPEQNFSYIAKLRPAIAFIIDIRRENRNLHLMYKALFELSADRADFVSRLFSRERPSGLGPQTGVDDLFAKFENAKRSDQLHEANARLIRERLTVQHGLALSPDDLESIDDAFNAFYSYGPDINYGRLRPDGSAAASYRFLMTAKDIGGHPRSYLVSEEEFTFVKHLQDANAIVPVVGDFAGSTAIRGAGESIRRRGHTVSAFYGSNVEVYLNREQSAAFCGNLAALPYDSRTWLIESKGMRPLSAKLKACLGGSR